MAGRGNSGRRIEPGFGDSRAAPGDDLRLQAGDRVGGGAAASGRRPKAEKPARQTGDRRRRSRGGGNGGGLLGFLRFAVYWCIVLGIWTGIALAGIVIYYGARMPSASTWSIPERPPNVKIAAVDGTVIANRGSTGGEAVSLQTMSPYIPQAVIAIEDRRF